MSRFTWDPAKAEKNRRKHKISFEEAASALCDPLIVMFPDEAHGEARINAIGMSAVGRVLFVVTLELEDDCWRIISARKAARHEQRQYEEG